MASFNRKSPLERELLLLYKQEESFLRGRYKKEAPIISRALEGKVPDKLQDTLTLAFSKAFTLIFQKGSGLIEKTCAKPRRQDAFFKDRVLLDAEMDKRSLRSFSMAAKRSGLENRLMSGAAGAGMGLLGIGLPDIPLFTALMLKSVYEAALSYGFEYDSEGERIFVLRVIRGAVARGESIYRLDRELNEYIHGGAWPEGVTLAQAEQETAAALADELLYMKFLQGIPVAGVVGGLYDAAYIRLISRYTELKYRRRFLLGLRLEKEP